MKIFTCKPNLKYTLILIATSIVLWADGSSGSSSSSNSSSSSCSINCSSNSSNSSVIFL